MSVKRPGLVERAAGMVAVKVCVLGQRLALKRGDGHEAMHWTAMIPYGNSGGEGDMGGCQLPASFWDDGRQFADSSRRFREQKEAGA